MNEQQKEQLILEIKRVFNLKGVTFIEEVSGMQYFEAVEKDGSIKLMRFNYGKIFVKEDGQWIRESEFFIDLRP
jgi:hypothetical protein